MAVKRFGHQRLYFKRTQLDPVIFVHDGYKERALKIFQEIVIFINMLTTSKTYKKYCSLIYYVQTGTLILNIKVNTGQMIYVI